MKELWSRYVQGPFSRALADVPWFGPVVSAVLVAMLVNVLTDALISWGGVALGWAAIGALALVVVAFVYAYHLSESQRRTQGLGLISDLPGPEKRRGLIFMFTRGETLREAIDYHQPMLERCWLLVTPEMHDSAVKMMGQFSDLQFSLHALPDLYNTQACYLVVRKIFRQEAPDLGIPPLQVIADITGGTKPMTMGMIVACLEGDYPIEHVPTVYEDGKPKGPLPPIQITVQRLPGGELERG